MILKRILCAALLVVGLAASASAQPFPAPILKYVGQHPDGGLIHVDLTVVNAAVYAPVLFAPAPNLPPCGTNTNSSRTWLDIYNAVTNVRIYGFCALGTPSAMTRIWFAAAPAAKPKVVYITLTDRLLRRRVMSNRVLIP